MSKENYEVTTDNVFADLDLDQPEELLARAELMSAVGALIKASKLTQKEIANKLGISQPKVSMLVSGRLSAFSNDTLMHYLYLIGCDVKISITKPRSRASIFKRKGRFAVKK